MGTAGKVKQEKHISEGQRGGGGKNGTRTFRHCGQLINHAAHDIFCGFPILQPAAHLDHQLIV